MENNHQPANEKFHRVPFITDIAKAQKTLDYDPARFIKLFTLNRGNPGSNMETFGLHCIVKNNETYQLTQNGLRIATTHTSSLPIDLEQRATHPPQVEQPPYLEIDATWDSAISVTGEHSNILGDNGRLLLPQKHIRIPAVIATEPLLAYYGATLIKNGDSIRFSNDVYPIWGMRISENYVRDFLMSAQGGGFYLEYHRDQPHFHYALKGAGHYLLAKWNDTHTKLKITAFQIPNGQAVYTKKGVIHCDAGLSGDYLVGYTTSQSYSTVLLRDASKQGAPVHVEFI